MADRRSALIEETETGFKVVLEGAWARVHLDQAHSAMRRQLTVQTQAMTQKASGAQKQEEANNG